MFVCLRFLKLGISSILNTVAGFFISLPGLFHFVIIFCLCYVSKNICVSLKTKMGL